MPALFYKALLIHLEKRKTKNIDIPKSIYDYLIGGRGLGAYLLYKYGLHVDPLSPDNPLILASGPLNTTKIPLTSKVGFYFRSPLTGFFGESYVGGSLPRYPKALGYDAIIILGRSERPTLLKIDEEGVEFIDASDFWGQGIVSIDEALRSEYGATISTVLIGPAGENLVRFAAISIDKWRQAGRVGGGAVMGSKNLKGIIFRGGGIIIDDLPDKFDDVLKEAIDRIRNYRGKEKIREYGTSAMANIADEMGFLPSYYWGNGTFDNFDGIEPEKIRKILRNPKSCWNCPFACGRYIRFSYGNKTYEMDGLEYETLYALGSLIGIDYIENVAYLNYLADDLGLDVISLGNVIGLAIEASRRGKIDKPLKYGDTEAIINLIRDIAHRRGLGDILAEGAKEASKHFGLDEIAVHVKGLEPAGYDPRRLKAMSIAYAVSPRGACHLRAMGYIIDIRRLAGEPSELTKKKVDKIIEFEEWMNAFDSLIICKFARDVYDFEFMVKMFNAATNKNYTIKQFRLAMRRTLTLIRLYNEKHGLTRQHDSLPPRFFKEPLKIGEQTYKLTKEEFDRALDYYYSRVGLNPDGTLTETTIKNLELDKILQNLK